MKTYTGRYLARVLSFALTVAVVAVGVAAAAPSEDRILSADQYTSDKARRLAAGHAKALRDLNASVYHCLPWLEIQKSSIGFFKPKGVTDDERYLSMRVYIEQDTSPQFARLRIDERAAAMFSRYVGPLLRRMAADPTIIADPALDGFTVILEWLKQVPVAAGDRPVHETVAVFLKKPVVADYLAGRVHVGQLAQRARVLGWDGETAVGPLKLSAWDDNFVSTYKVANYEMEKGVTCR